ncbi:MAG TPA: aminoacyl-tRNA hydrolase [Caldithrix sp.]|nr:aminoacyl-tRNA hydrolase [Caldithrix sp.]
MNVTRLFITRHIFISLNEINFSAIRAQGPGGQHVNKVASAIQLRFDIPASSLPDYLKERLLHMCDARINNDGIVIIKSQQHRSQKKNKDNALARLQALIRNALIVPKSRIPTKPSKTSNEKRIETKKRHGQIKKLRKNIFID